MMAEILSGKQMSEQLTQEQKERVAALRAQGIVPGLAVILAGENPASEIYVRNKKTMCATIGVHSEVVRLPNDVSQEDLIAHVERLNQDPAIHGILVQLPLPEHLDEAAVLARVLPEKDVDGFHVVNAGKLFAGLPGVVPCTPKGILYMLQQAGIELKGKEAVVIGRSNIVGKPVAMLLLQEHCTVTICHSRTQNLKDVTRRADILVAAIGKPRFVTADMVKPGATVIDVGVNRVDGKVCGDVDFDAVKEVAGHLTPVPGGVGKMTISMLMENTLEAACRSAR
ncbi:MAG: bifunctional methylenetetrahydrofolate dehydrogenase/methenyltetrahydrofolate cyclohydrolase FolD [Clostridiales bacterium]|nr:bifunctional methylenetetrahydrofolate dehydrogenase/methenyltetrahydrofolate cyclohydrolase FolD [Clostridiales bacterium]